MLPGAAREPLNPPSLAGSGSSNGLTSCMVYAHSVSTITLKHAGFTLAVALPSEDKYPATTAPAAGVRWSSQPMAALLVPWPPLQAPLQA